MQLINLPDWMENKGKRKNTHTHTNSFGRWRQYNAVLSICLACCAMHIATFGKLVDICCLFTNASVIMHAWHNVTKYTPHQLYHHRWMLPYLNPMHSTLQINRNDNKHIWSYCIPLRFFFFVLFVGIGFCWWHSIGSAYTCGYFWVFSWKKIPKKKIPKRSRKQKRKNEVTRWAQSAT